MPTSTNRETVDVQELERQDVERRTLATLTSSTIPVGYDALLVAIETFLEAKLEQAKEFEQKKIKAHP